MNRFIVTDWAPSIKATSESTSSKTEFHGSIDTPPPVSTVSLSLQAVRRHKPFSYNISYWREFKEVRVE